MFPSGGSWSKILGGAKTILHSKVQLINYYKYECMQHIKICCLLNMRF
jgi:hypothetical protein